ncbi:MAG: amino acid ABC transporter permease [Pantoea sp.]|uniref:amino acid ABC transporter permease n=1 Tax=Pantoea TaxID=53335 RepID=UPI00066113BC|nr:MULTISPECIES: amino acid ABC transporter permease [Pantoea]MBS6437487.1 amino acid ABC transporter permease [Pantoea sp.]MDU2730733.1 amino acid ABC transporter permease [Pantoea sp.]MDU5474648.1 amino acid ABC transporter permease [Pantoea sp.]MDU7839950.1 amino acid ABC transporter permease [Pantoea sp.]HAB26293.1 amino acid ABC transporter permease [Pantoea sp.]
MSQRPSVKRDISFGNPAVRAWLYQIIAIVAVVIVVGYLIHNTIINLASRGITSGFGFLERSAGFGIVQHLIEYTEGDTYARVFLVGLTNTLLVSALCIVFASLLGFFIGLARLSDNWLLRKLSTIYIETFRNIPPLLQIFFWYFAVLRNLPGPRQALSAFDLAFVSNRGLYVPWPQYAPGSGPFIVALALAAAGSYALFRYHRKYQLKTGQLRRTWPAALAMFVLFPVVAHLGFGAATHWDVPTLRGFNFRGGFVMIPELAALTLALSVYTSSFIAEVIRAGIQSVPHGQHEAARSLGLPNPVTLRQVIIPQAMRVIIPPLTSQYLNIVKNSSLAAAIGYPDMVSLFAGTVLNQTGQAIETIAITMGVYLVISLVISLLMNIYNRKIALVER